MRRVLPAIAAIATWTALVFVLVNGVVAADFFLVWVIGVALILPVFAYGLGARWRWTNRHTVMVVAFTVLALLWFNLAHGANVSPYPWDWLVAVMA